MQLQPLVLGSAILFSILLVFLIAATGDTEFATETSAGVSIYTGAFQVCFGGRTSSCSAIDNSCKINLPGSLGGNQVGPIYNDCTKFHAFQAFLLLGLFTLIAVVFTVWFYVAWETPSLIYATLILAGISNFCLMVSFSCFADLTSSNTSARGASFALEVTVWVLELVGLVLFGVGTLVLAGSSGVRTGGGVPNN